MADLIDRQAVLKEIQAEFNPCTNMHTCITLSHLKETIENLPSADITGKIQKLIEKYIAEEIEFEEFLKSIGGHRLTSTCLYEIIADLKEVLGDG